MIVLNLSSIKDKTTKRCLPTHITTGDLATTTTHITTGVITTTTITVVMSVSIYTKTVIFIIILRVCSVILCSSY